MKLSSQPQTAEQRLDGLASLMGVPRFVRPEDPGAVAELQAAVPGADAWMVCARSRELVRQVVQARREFSGRLAQRNPLPPCDDMVFLEDSHTYWQRRVAPHPAHRTSTDAAVLREQHHCGQLRVRGSVTSCYSSFFSHPDFSVIARRQAKAKLGGGLRDAARTAQLEKDAADAGRLKTRMWDNNRDSGTLGHLVVELMAEGWAGGTPEEEKTWGPEYPQVRQYLTDLKSTGLRFWRVELCLSMLGAYELAGQADGILEDADGNLYIRDWKFTFVGLRSRGFKGARAAGILSHLDDCNLVKYSLQQNLYRCMLRAMLDRCGGRDARRRIVNLKLVVFNPTKTVYEEVDVPDYQREVQQILLMRRSGLLLVTTNVLDHGMRAWEEEQRTAASQQQQRSTSVGTARVPVTLAMTATSRQTPVTKTVAVNLWLERTARLLELPPSLETDPDSLRRRYQYVAEQAAKLHAKLWPQLPGAHPDPERPRDPNKQFVWGVGEVQSTEYSWLGTLAGNERPLF